jgi:hypothetical protein
MLLPVWNHPTEVIQGAPAPQATACANPGQIAVTYVSCCLITRKNKFPKYFTL